MRESFGEEGEAGVESRDGNVGRELFFSCDGSVIRTQKRGRGFWFDIPPPGCGSEGP